MKLWYLPRATVLTTTASRHSPLCAHKTILLPAFDCIAPYLGYKKIVTRTFEIREYPRAHLFFNEVSYILKASDLQEEHVEDKVQAQGSKVQECGQRTPKLVCVRTRDYQLATINPTPKRKAQTIISLLRSKDIQNNSTWFW